MEVRFNSGVINAEFLNAILLQLPLDITIVNARDEMIYFNDKKDKIFMRKKEHLKTDIRNCHKEKTQQKLEQLLEAFKKGHKKEEQFILEYGEKLVWTKYIAIKDANNNYLGTVEVTQELPSNAWHFQKKQ